MIRLFLYLIAPVFLSGCLSTHVNLPRDSYLFVTKRVETKDCTGDQCSVSVSATTGSGFVLRSDSRGSWGVTAGHLCSWSPNGSEVLVIHDAIQVHLFGGGTHSAVVAIVEPSVDICVIHIPNVEIPPVKVSRISPKLGDKVYNLASPLGVFEPTLIPQFSGYYSGTSLYPIKGMTGSSVPFDAYTIPARPGSSGSPIFNQSGEVIGMTSIALIHFENFALSPPHQVLVMLEEAVSNLSYGR